MNTALSQALKFVQDAPKNVGGFINENIVWPVQKMTPQYQQQQKKATAYQTAVEARQLQAMGQVHDDPRQMNKNYVYKGVIKEQPTKQTDAAAAFWSMFPSKNARAEAKPIATIGVVKKTTPTPSMMPTATPTPIPPTPTPNPYLDAYEDATPPQYLKTIANASSEYKVPMSILSAMLAHESMSWNPKVISGELASQAGAQGIAQFMPATAKGMGIDPLNTDQAIQGAARKLAAHYKQFGSWQLALAAYNAGAGHVADFLNGTNFTGNNPKRIKTGGIPDFVETRNYVPHILDRAKTKVKKYSE